jgi:hypothetical protein
MFEDDPLGLGMVNWVSAELTLIVWKSESPLLRWVRFKLGSNFEGWSVNGRAFPLESVLDVLFTCGGLRDDFMANHTTPDMAANVAIVAHQREGTTRAITISITTAVVVVDTRELPFFVLDIVCFHGVRLAYWKYLHFSRIRQASRSPSVIPAKGERLYRLLLAGSSTTRSVS